MIPPAAVFDLDGTLTRSDCTRHLLLHALPRRPARWPRLVPLPWTLARHRLGLIETAEFKQGVLRAVLGGASRREIDALVARLLPTWLADVKPQARARLDWHRSRGHRLVLASAGLDLCVQPIGRALGFETIVATRVAWHENRLTGALDGPNLKAAAKRAAVQTVFADARPARIYAYSDDVSDLPLLRYADEAVAVDPHPPLARAAAAAGLRVEHWAR